MKTRTTLSIFIPLLLAVAIGCATSERQAVNDYYKAKQIFLTVAEEAYDYAANPATPQQDRELIKSVGLRAFDVIDKIDFGLESYERGRELLWNAIYQFKAITNKPIEITSEEPEPDLIIDITPDMWMGDIVMDATQFPIIQFNTEESN